MRALEEGVRGRRNRRRSVMAEAPSRRPVCGGGAGYLTCTNFTRSALSVLPIIQTRPLSARVLLLLLSCCWLAAGSSSRVGSGHGVGSGAGSGSGSAPELAEASISQIC